MVASSLALAAVANIFISHSLAAALPSALERVVPRGGGFPASNPPGVTCYNTWETVTNDVRKRYIPYAPQRQFLEDECTLLLTLCFLARRPVLVRGRD